MHNKPASQEKPDLRQRSDGKDRNDVDRDTYHTDHGSVISNAEQPLKGAHEIRILFRIAAGSLNPIADAEALLEKERCEKCEQANDYKADGLQRSDRHGANQNCTPASWRKGEERDIADLVPPHRARDRARRAKSPKVHKDFSERER